MSDPDAFATHRFGINYVPSGNWSYCWNDWHPENVARDFDAIAQVGVDHLRVIPVWPWFQPNPATVSAAHLDRLDQTVTLAAARGLDVQVALYTGWLSGFAFKPPYLEDQPFFASDAWRAVQTRYAEAVGARMNAHGNFLGFDIGNEINCAWATDTVTGDRWMREVFADLKRIAPGRVHVNGVDNKPWFLEDSFSPEALVAEQEVVALHCWSFWTGAGEHGGPLDRAYTQLPAAMTALVRSHGRSPAKPVWVQEFGACDAEMPVADVARWMEAALEGAVAQGVGWFTWWCSHDVDRAFEFHPFEYDLGLLTTDNRIKDRGRTFRRLAEHYRGKPVAIPTRPLPPPPAERTMAATWRWLLDWMEAAR